MAKRRRTAAKKSTGSGGPPMGPMGGMKGGLGGNMTQQLQSLQQQMLDAQEALSDESISVTAGGGAIEIEITGGQKLTNIKIDPDIIDPDDVESLQDLILAAVNEAIEKSQALASERMDGLTGGLNIPGLF